MKFRKNNKAKKPEVKTENKTVKRIEVDETKLAILESILIVKRPHLSQSEAAFIATHLDTVQGMNSDRHGNRFVTIGENPITMFSCHTDTVHKSEGIQSVYLDSLSGDLFVSEDCLGADDGAGIYIMLEMIKAKVKGHYVFHRGEERGGIGSDGYSQDNVKLLETFKHCIAFDRKGYGDVITHQFGGRCCSDDFALALSDKLGGQYMPDSGGSFTDSANYTHLISECTNVSVGYENQHTYKETQDVNFLFDLAEKCCQIDWETLPAVRTPEDDDLYNDLTYWNTFNTRQTDKFFGLGKEESYYYEYLDEHNLERDLWDYGYSLENHKEVLTLCERDPELAAEVICKLHGVTK